MLLAYIWHFWIGVILLAVGILTTVGLVGAYLKTVEAKRFPDRRHGQDD